MEIIHKWNERFELKPFMGEKTSPEVVSSGAE